jgi:hypothetical protein
MYIVIYMYDIMSTHPPFTIQQNGVYVNDKLVINVTEKITSYGSTLDASILNAARAALYASKSSMCAATPMSSPVVGPLPPYGIPPPFTPFGMPPPIAGPLPPYGMPPPIAGPLPYGMPPPIAGPPPYLVPYAMPSPIFNQPPLVSQSVPFKKENSKKTS